MLEPHVIKRLKHLAQPVRERWEVVSFACQRGSRGDNKGRRFTLLAAAIFHRDAATGDELLRMFSDDHSASFLYGSTLQAFSAGDRARARALLRQARRANRQALKYLTSDDEPPDVQVPFYQPGDDAEAIIIAQSFGALWRSVPGALEWIRKEAKKR